MPDDDRAAREHLAALEAEVKAEADAARERKAEALAELRTKRAAQQEAARPRPAAKQAAAKQLKAPRERSPLEDLSDARANVGDALELATRANRVRNELAKKPGKGEKSWMISGVASLAAGPLGWLYAGSLREAIPAGAVWVLLLALASKILPTVLLWPVLMVVMPLSGIAGVVYALQYNRHGGRQRLFDNEKKQLGPGREE